MEFNSSTTQSRLATPPWWSASPADFARLVALRTEILEHDQAVARTARNIVGGTLLGAVSFYSMDAAGALAIASDTSGVLVLVAATALVGVITWIVDLRLVEQIFDTSLRARLWLGLIEAVRHGGVDPALIDAESGQATPVEKLLRIEARAAARCVAADGSLQPSVPFFGNCFTLHKARPAL
jgi:hypothetical protein